MKTIHHIYQHLNGFAVNGAQNSPDAQDFTVKNDQVLKSQLMIRLKALEKQNAELKKNLEQSQNEITEIIAVHKKIFQYLRHSIPLRFVVRADIQASQSIIRNLISNAIKFTKPGGRITISAKEANSFIEIIVKDDGIGIPLTKQQDLFKNDPLELPSGSSNIKDKGLGLMLCKKFVEIQGGTIRVESRQDKGSSFIFTLPKYE